MVLGLVMKEENYNNKSNNNIYIPGIEHPLDLDVNEELMLFTLLNRSLMLSRKRS